MVPQHFVASQRHDDPLDLPPVAEAHDIAVVAAALGADGRLKPRVFAIAGDQLCGVVERASTMDEGESMGLV